MVRRYTDQPVSPETVTELVKLGLQAPSAGFTQGVAFQVLTAGDRDRFWQVAASGESRWLAGMRTAAVLILVWCNRAAYYSRYTELDKGWDADDQPWTAPYWYVDAGMGAENILLAATERGLGACFFGIPQDRVDRVRDTFGVPAEELSVGVISLGWPHPDVLRPNEPLTGSPRHRPRRPPTDLVHWGDW